MHCLVAEAKRTIATHIVWQPAPVGGQDCPTGDDSDRQQYNSRRPHEYQEGSKIFEEYQAYSGISFLLTRTQDDDKPGA